METGKLQAPTEKPNKNQIKLGKASHLGITVQ